LIAKGFKIVIFGSRFCILGVPPRPFIMLMAAIPRTPWPFQTLWLITICGLRKLSPKAPS
jgi:hypothetical protein